MWNLMFLGKVNVLKVWMKFCEGVEEREMDFDVFRASRTVREVGLF